MDVSRRALALAGGVLLLSCPGQDPIDGNCGEGSVSCSEDGLAILSCVEGAWLESGDCWQTDGRLYPMALTDTPGYLALLALSFVKTAAEGSDREDLRAYYDDCLLQRGGELDCLPWPGQEPRPFTDYFPAMLMYTGEGSCKSNWNNFSMAIELPIMQVSTEKYRSTDISGDYAAMARAFGGYGERVTEPGEIVVAIKRGIEATEAGQPALLEFITKKETEISIFS